MPNFTLLVPLLIISVSLSAQPSFLDKKYDKDSAVNDFRKIFKEVSLGHPGFYTYHSRPVMNAYMDSVAHTFEVTAVDHSKNFGRGAMPDHPVTPTLEQIINGQDVAMQYALMLIRAVSTNPQ